MKRLKTAGLVVLTAVVLAGIIVSVIGLPEYVRRLTIGDMFRRATDGNMGFYLSGDVVTTHVTDWSFSDAFHDIKIETRTPFLVRHWVSSYVARSDDRIFLFSDYFAPAPGKTDLRDRFPEARFWNRMVLRDPRIRLKIGERVFEARAYALTDPNDSLVEVARQAFWNKYAEVREQQAWPAERRPRMHFFRVEPIP